MKKMKRIKIFINRLTISLATVLVAGILLLIQDALKYPAISIRIGFR